MKKSLLHRSFFSPLFIIILMTFAVAVSCTMKKGTEKQTASGYKYIIYTKSEGPKISIGDYITIVMVYRNDKDSILFDSRNANVPVRFQLDKIPFKGSFEDGLTNLSLNDSATFFVPADSLFNYMFRKEGTGMLPQGQTAFTPGSMLRFDIKVLRIQAAAEAEQDIVSGLSEADRKEQKDLNKYIYDHAIKANPDPAGFYMIMREDGSGEPVDSGKIITVEYEGRFLDGKVFDGTKEAGHPYRFVSGAHHVVKGWELALKKLKSGDKITLILPSSLAYGEEGIRRTEDGTFIVPPYTPVIFDIDIVSAEDVPAVSGN